MRDDVWNALLAGLIVLVVILAFILAGGLR